MSVEEKLVNRILSVGSAGIKKTDLRREFGDIDTALENTIARVIFSLTSEPMLTFASTKTTMSKASSTQIQGSS